MKEILIALTGVLILGLLTFIPPLFWGAEASLPGIVVNVFVFIGLSR